MIRGALIVFFAATGPLMGLFSFIFAFYMLKLFVNENFQHDDFFSSETIGLVYLVGFIPALVVGGVSSFAIEKKGRFSLQRTLLASAVVGILMSSPLLLFGYDTPPHSLSERLPAATMILWVNIGAALLSWIVWELFRRAVMKTWKDGEA